MRIRQLLFLYRAARERGLKRCAAAREALYWRRALSFPRGRVFGR